MENDLNTLEERVSAVAALCKELQRENASLRSRLASSEQEKLALTQRMNTALERIEALMSSLSETHQG